MSRLSPRLFVVVCLILFGLFSRSRCLGGEPSEQVRAMLEAVMSVQTDPRFRGEAFKAGRRAAIRKIIGNNFASWRMAEEALGAHWAELDEKERGAFTGIFSDLFQDSYTRLVLNFLKEETVLYTEEDVREGEGEVKTVIIRPQERIPVDYFLSPSKEGWRVHDVRIDGVSIVDNYRKSFARVINRESYGALLEKMRLQQRAVASGNP